MILQKIEVTKYNQKGEGVIFYNNKPFYVFGVIVKEIVDVKIEKEFPKYGIAKLIKIHKISKNRTKINVDNVENIGGYELIHMNDIEQENFKKNRVFEDFKKISNTKLRDVYFIKGEKRFKYRNKITLHDGGFYKKRTNEVIDLNDYLLSDIKYDKRLKGEIIYRKLDTLIFGSKKDKKYTTDTMLGYKFRVGLNSFYQINKEIAEKVYLEIQKNILKGGTTLDLYSGIGTITIISSKFSNKVIGVERNKNSFNDAIFNIKENNINNIEFYNLSVENFVNNNLASTKINTLILDPSREGVGKNVLNNLIKSTSPERIIYLSCNPATQASDFNALKEEYKIFSCQIYDMFPQTYHVECLLILNKK